MAVELLEIEGLHARLGTDGPEILRGVDLRLGAGEVSVIMGPNASGKSTLAKVLSGHPAYEVTAGTVSFLGEDLLGLDASARARAGLFMAFQYPVALPGVSVANLLRVSVQARRGEEELDVFEFSEALSERMELLGLDASFAERSVNDGFSGGEKKRSEILQLAVLEPALAVLDETDSGLDIDALRLVASGVNELRRERPDLSLLLITHYQRILEYVRPDRVHVMVAGRIVRSGGPELALALESKGYDWVRAGL